MRHVVCSAAFALALSSIPAFAQDYVTFRAPSGNIACMMDTWDGGTARCDIREYTPNFPNRPGWCDQDYGFAFAVEATGPGVVVCAGDTVFDPGAGVLEYGRSYTLGPVTCTSERTGMTCVNRQGHGFMVSRAAQRVF